jgi:hypothetical protein
MRKIVKGGGLKANTLKSMIKSTYDRSNVEGWQKIMDTPETSAFKHPSGQVVIALRGTEGTAKDWSNNAVYGLGGESAYKQTPRYKRAKERVAELEKKYNPEDISLVGHSQGALLAEIVPSKAREIITLNKASRPQDALFRRRKKNQYDIRSRFDPVSFFPLQKSNYTIDGVSLNPLAQHSPDVLEGDKVYGDKKYGNGIRHVKRGGKIIVRSYNERPENRFIEGPTDMF